MVTTPIQHGIAREIPYAEEFPTRTFATGFDGTWFNIIWDEFQLGWAPYRAAVAVGPSDYPTNEL